MRLSIYLLLSLILGTVSWLLAFNVFRWINRLLRVDPSRWWTPVSHAFVPITASLMLVMCLFLTPLVFKVYIKDWNFFLKVWTFGFMGGGLIIARVIWGKPGF